MIKIILAFCVLKCSSHAFNNTKHSYNCTKQQRKRATSNSKSLVGSK